MPELVEKGYILSFDEIRILLYSTGIRTVEGIYMPEKDFSEEEVLKALHHLSEQGLITARGERFAIDGELKDLLRVMGNAEASMIWDEGNGEAPKYFCYFLKGQVVVSERYWKKKETLKLRLFTEEAFAVWKEQVREDDHRDYSTGDGEAV